MKKLNIIALLLFLVAVVAVFTLNTPTTRSIQSQVMAVLAPFIHSSAAIDQAMDSAVAPALDPHELKRDNERLRIEVERLKIVSQRYSQLQDENDKQTSEFKVTPARVVKRVAGTWWNTLIIDKGALDGIGTDSPVITSMGLVGKTGKLAPHMTEVILLTDEMCRVSARIVGSLEQGIISGERAGLDVRPDLRLRFLSRNALINVGAEVYSSGEGGVFPANLLLGRVKRFENKDISGEAIVEPAVDFSMLDYVFVIEMQSNATP